MPDVRPRTEADLPACVSALREVHVADGYPLHWPADPVAWLSPPRLGAWVIGAETVAAVSGGDNLAGAAVDGHILLVPGAAADLALAQAISVPVDSLALVSRLFVRPGARGRAVAARLLRAARDAAGDRLLALEVDVTATGAVACYEALGWTRVGTAQAHWLTASGQPAQVHHYVQSDYPPPQG